MNANYLKIASIVVIVAGTVGLFLSGSGHDPFFANVGVVFVLAVGHIADMFKMELK